MIDIFLYKSSPTIIKEYLNSLSGAQKRGAHQSIAHALGIFPSYLSLILKGDRNLNLDQGMLLADYLKLKKSHRRYLLRVIELDRAQGAMLKAEIESELAEISSKEQQISSKVEKDHLALSYEEAAVFFSSWKYSAIHLMAATQSQMNPTIISKKLKIDIDEVKDIFRFLLKSGLWKKTDQKIEIGTSFIHLNHQSHFLKNLHMNWRIKAIDRHPSMDKDTELAYSGSLVLSEKDVLKIRGILLKAIEEVRKVSDPSPSEVIYNLNVDWLKVLGKD